MEKAPYCQKRAGLGRLKGSVSSLTMGTVSTLRCLLLDNHFAERCWLDTGDTEIRNGGNVRIAIIGGFGVGAKK